MSVEMLKLTGNSVIADELELSTWNSVIGMHSPSGRWCTYNTPMDGVRKASAHDIVFQAREGAPELNCCSVNSARGLGLISEWALLHDPDGIVLNWFGPSEMTTTLANGVSLQLVQKTDYPRSGKILLEVSPSKAAAFTLKLRVPHWSTKTRVKVNSQEMGGIKPGEYLTLNRDWQITNRIEIELDFSLHYWLGEKECQGKASLYRGPILLTYDRKYNEVDPQNLPTLDLNGISSAIVAKPTGKLPMVLLEVSDKARAKLRLCDFGSAGNGGSPYLSWLKVKNGLPGEFSRSNPLRSSRLRTE